MPSPTCCSRSTSTVDTWTTAPQRPLAGDARPSSSQDGERGGCAAWPRRPAWRHCGRRNEAGTSTGGAVRTAAGHGQALVRVVGVAQGREFRAKAAVRVLSRRHHRAQGGRNSGSRAWPTSTADRLPNRQSFLDRSTWRSSAPSPFGRGWPCCSWTSTASDGHTPGPRRGDMILQWAADRPGPGAAIVRPVVARHLARDEVELAPWGRRVHGR